MASCSRPASQTTTERWSKARGRARALCTDMGYRLAPHHHVAVVGDRAILLDTKADRYIALGELAATVLQHLEHAGSETPGVSTLVRLGIIEPGPFEDPRPKLSAARASAIELAPVCHGRLGLFSLVCAIANAYLSLRSRGLAATLARLAKPALLHSADADRLVAFAQAYVRQRAHLPLRHICLPDSLALHHLLTSRGMSASLVIGVRLNPFGAHCWVQASDTVLNDTCDTVSGFTPILVI